MILNLIFSCIILIIGAIFSWLPVVTTLPTIGGFDIDSAFVTGMSQLHTVMVTFWFLQDMFFGFLFIMLYFSVKLGLRFFLGHRVP